MCSDEIKLAHSYSSIKMYENCPYRYYRQRVVKDVVDEGSLHTKAGEAVHKAFELRLKDKVSLPDQLAKFEGLCKAIEDKDGELLVEKELTLTDNLEPTDWFSKDAFFRSKLDVLNVDGDTGAIIDWKTGKRRVDSFQLALFAAQVFQHYKDVDKVKAALVWINSQDMDVFSYSRDDAKGIWLEVLSRINRIENSVKKDIWQVRPSGLCKFCPCNGNCPATK